MGGGLGVSPERAAARWPGVGGGLPGCAKNTGVKTPHTGQRPWGPCPAPHMPGHWPRPGPGLAQALPGTPALLPPPCPPAAGRAAPALPLGCPPPHVWLETVLQPQPVDPRAADGQGWGPAPALHAVGVPREHGPALGPGTHVCGYVESGRSDGPRCVWVGGPRRRAWPTSAARRGAAWGSCPEGR